MMGCEEVRDLLALVAGGEARDEDRGAVEDHVSHCAACARELDLYRESRAHLAVLRDGDAPSGTWKSIWSGVKAEVFPRKPSSALAVFDVSLRFAAVLMVGVAIGVAAYLVSRPAPAAADRESILAPADTFATPGPRTGPVRTVTAHPSPFRLDVESGPKFYVPRVKPDGNSYLPRVEAIPVTGERDF
jgi:anti-sigma factor RsiW